MTDAPEREPSTTPEPPTSRLTKVAVGAGLAALALVALLCVLALTVGPALLVDAGSSTDGTRSDARLALLLAAAVVAIAAASAVGAWHLQLAQRRAQALQHGVAVERDQNERRLAEIDRRIDEMTRWSARAEMTQRFESAVRLLGDDGNVGARLGGIFALERLAVEARERREPWTGEGPEPTDLRHTVERVLAAFARHPSSAPPPADPDTVPTVAPDVAAILAVLGRFGYPPTYDLQGVRAPRVDLRWAVLRWADLRGADLRHADLEGTVLAHADLRAADLTHADLEGADLREADLRAAVLREGYLKRAYLQHADLRDADLHRADLGGADLTGADLTGADLSGAYLRDAISDESTIWPEGVGPTAG